MRRKPMYVCLALEILPAFFHFLESFVAEASFAVRRVGGEGIVYAYSNSFSVRLYCKMDFSDYPFDGHRYAFNTF